jgi:flagella basal body P-ring formation protein FlgA
MHIDYVANRVTPISAERRNPEAARRCQTNTPNRHGPCIRLPHGFTESEMSYRTLTVWLLILPLLSPIAQATDYQSLEAVRAAVEDFVRNDLEGPGRLADVRVERLDPRLRLARCAAPLTVWQLAGYNSAGRLTLGVRCSAPKPWKLYVPVVLERRLEVVVAARPVATGQRLRADDLRLAERDIARLRDDYFVDPGAVIGQEVRQMLRAGDVVGQRAVRPATVIRRGQTLMIEASDGTVTVSMRGEALQNGRRGELIRVRNLSSQRVIDARVVGPDRVRVIF